MLSEIKNIYFIGIGALGGMYASLLFDYDPSIVKVILDKKRIARYQSEGFFVNGKKYDFDYIESIDFENFAKADVIFIGVKYDQLDEAIQIAKPFLKEDTRIISILNGIVSEEKIGQILGMQHMLYAYGVGMDAFREKTHIRYSRSGKIVFGEKHNNSISSDVVKLQQLFKSASISFETPKDMTMALWNKLMLNVSVNQTTAALKFYFGDLKKSHHAQNIVRKTAKEVFDIAHKKGIALSEDSLEHVLDNVLILADNGTTSMCQDILAKRKTEIAMFGETIIQMGEELGIPTPMNSILVEMIKAREDTFE